MPNPLRIDPTRTTLLRRKFAADMLRRFRALRRDIINLVDKEDAFGLRVPRSPFVFNTRWQFQADDGKLDSYREWLRAQVEAGILEVEPVYRDTPWLASYIQSAYRRGLVRAYIDTNRVALAAATDPSFVAGGQAAFLDMAFNSPVGESKVRLLATRAFSQLQGVTAKMDQDMSRILAQGMAAGTGPRKLARTLSREVAGLEKKRAVVIARTETAYAHSEGQLDAFEALGVEEVGVMAEWLTAADGAVCPMCYPMQGVVLTVKEARGMIPRHPNCRCAWIPANVGEVRFGTTTTTFAGPEQGRSKTIRLPGGGYANPLKPTGVTVRQSRSRAEIQRRIQESLRAEKPKLTTKGARAQSQWVGADAKIAKDRPKSQ